ncbi:hypothetical protein [Mycobacterium deserti]|uniref:Uncharacterized protein n=1 Tax=Mycobacterium deserti TaxID=2978347 RepID=A0ABT2MIA6_9MYCO|nr:hypothetical protein [Mycobacterium deserti]MCT7660825.1 hypothetical protein [Mycobacterium deserti]
MAAVVAAILRDPTARIGQVYELTGPQALDITGLAEQYWESGELASIGLSAHVAQHIATMARLHRNGRYDRGTDDVERIIGRRPQTVEQYIASNPHLFY